MTPVTMTYVRKNEAAGALRPRVQKVQKGPSILRNTTQALEPKVDSHRLSRFRDLACEPEE